MMNVIVLSVIVLNDVALMLCFENSMFNCIYISMTRLKMLVGGRNA